jgi:hypothetical protein
MVYLAGNTEDVLYQIDARTDTFAIDEGCHPNGMAINPETGQALLACANRQRPHTVIWDLKHHCSRPSRRPGQDALLPARPNSRLQTESAGDDPDEQKDVADAESNAIVAEVVRQEEQPLPALSLNPQGAGATPCPAPAHRHGHEAAVRQGD